MIMCERERAKERYRKMGKERKSKWPFAYFPSLSNSYYFSHRFMLFANESL